MRDHRDCKKVLYHLSLQILIIPFAGTGGQDTIMLMRRVVLLTTAVIATLAFAGCELARDSQPSVLVVAVEGLSFETLNCDAEELEGLKSFCEEAVRFSHAYTPSNMSQSALTSLLTGLYPFDHGVRHNGGENFLSARFRTLAEGALSRKYHTLFVSGGPPIWRKSGLAQGFEVFDDSMDLSAGVYYRPAGEVVRLTTRWIDELSDGRPTFAVLFLADLQFPEVATRTNEGVVRELSSEAQLLEVVESVGTLVKWLKERRKWNSSHIVLLGLNSLSDENLKGESLALSLRSAATQISLFIKPARRERDNIIQWAVDRNVSLVDVGHTIFQWLGLDPPPSSLAALQPQSLLAALSESEPLWNENHLVLSETAWPDWLEGAGVRWALRQNQFLYIHDQKPMVFNTLTDRLESLPLRASDPLWNSVNGSIMNLLNKAQTPPFKGMNPHWPEQLEVAKELWKEGLATRNPKGTETWSKWYLLEALKERKWREVKRLSQELGEPVGSFVAARHLGETLPMPRNPCVRLLLATKGDKKTFQSECEDERVLALYAWTIARKDEERQVAQERFVRLHLQTRMDLEIGRMNYLNDLRWDVDRQMPDLPQTVDYLLTLKEFDQFARRISVVFSAKDGRF